MWCVIRAAEEREEEDEEKVYPHHEQDPQWSHRKTVMYLSHLATCGADGQDEIAVVAASTQLIHRPS